MSVPRFPENNDLARPDAEPMDPEYAIWLVSILDELAPYRAEAEAAYLNREGVNHGESKTHPD